MQTFDVHILGCGSALPTRRHLPSAQVVNLRDKLLLLDCGEGTQLAWRQTGLNWQKVGHILITHAHGDHVFGLPGFLSTMALLGRTAPIDLHAPASLRPFVQCILANFCAGMPFEVRFHAVDTTRHQMLFDDRSLEVWSLPLRHRVPCCGFLIREKPGLPHIRRQLTDFYNIPLWALNRIKQGEDWQRPDGTLVPNHILTSPPDPARAYAYCTDTMPVPALAEWCEGADLMFHEATYADAEARQAEARAHSTARQAAQAASDARAKRLLIGHFSSRYDDESLLLQQAREVFPATTLAREGMKIAL